MAEYKILDVVRLGVAAARSRIPPLFPSFIDNEWSGVLSDQVARGEWVQVDDINIVNQKGQDVFGALEDYLVPRPHCEIPKAVVEVRNEVWTSGSLTLQAERWKEIRRVFSPGKAGDALATASLREEAALYGVKPGSIEKGVAPGSKPKGDGDTSENPWMKSTWRFGEESRQAKILSIIKTSSKLAADMAAKAGVSLSGHALRR
jgi:hypothetical protein